MRTKSKTRRGGSKTRRGETRRRACVTVAAVILAGALTVPAPAAAVEGAPGAQVVALGDAGTALGRPEASALNPAVLAGLGESRILTAWGRWFGDTQGGQLLWCSPIRPGRIAGVTAARQGWSLGYSGSVTGGVEARSATNLAGGTLNYARHRVGVAFGHSGPGGVDLGYALRWLTEGAAGSAWRTAVSADLGARRGLTPRVGLGLSIRNLAQAAETQGRVGLAVDLTRALVIGDLAVPLQGVPYVAAGVEAPVGRWMSVRAGYRTGPVAVARLGYASGLSGGMGIVVHCVAVDYAVLPFGDLGATHRVAVAWRFLSPATTSSAGPTAASVTAARLDRWLARGRSHEKRRQLFWATDEYLKVKAEAPGYGNALEALDRIQAHQEKVVEADPVLGETRENFYAQAYLHVQAGRFSQAAAALERLAFVEPHNREVADVLARCRAQMSSALTPSTTAAAGVSPEPEPRSHSRQRAVREDAGPPVESASPREIEERYHRGLSHYSAGRLTEAIREWEIVLRLHPKHPHARKALKRAREELAPR